MKPTDDELLQEWYRVSHITDTGKRRLSVMRAVLAKWGAPASARCKSCGTHEVSQQQTCQNSTCAAYAQDVTIYEGWKSPAPASQPVAVPAGMEPVAWVEVHPGLDGWFLAYSFNPDAKTEPLYTAAQVQAMLAAVPRNATLYDPDDVAFPVRRCADGADAPTELTSIAKQASIAAAEVTAPSGPAREPLRCSCHTCWPISVAEPASMFMRLCPSCGNKRCSKANDHRHDCTGSNEPGQQGSAYPSHGITAAQKGGQHG